VVGSSGAPGRASRLIAEGGSLFTYGTLQFPEVLMVLLGRSPKTEPAAVSGWRAAALAGRSYPGLVAAAGTATGRVLSGLGRQDIQIIDDFESGPYELRPLTLADGLTAWAYVWTDLAAVRPEDWSCEDFAARTLATFVLRCRDWRLSYEAAGRLGADLHRPQDA
jgi:gamma-glutamylcyclotransferase (GGCT)/AIG2-like uncharacterized protein YtfP